MSINAAAIGVSGRTSETLTVVFVQLKGTEHSGALDLLRLFAHGIWSDYKSNAQMLPALEPQQELKLKQLTVMTLAERSKVLPYDLLMQQLNISNVRELEDLLINDCMYSGIVRGKLDQRRRCFEVSLFLNPSLEMQFFTNVQIWSNLQEMVKHKS
jgi:hypothetical protein